MLIMIRNLMITGAIVCLITYKACRGKQQLQRRVSGMLLISCCSLIVFWLTGITPRSGFQPIVDWSTVQPVPFRGIRTVLYYGITFYAVENILGNIIMMMPLGFLLPFFFKNLRKWYWIGLIGGALSLLIEGSQLFLCRGTDIDDVLLNLTGAVIGYYIWKLFWRKLDEWFGLEESDRHWKYLWLFAVLVPYVTEVVSGFVDLLIRRIGM